MTDAERLDIICGEFLRLKPHFDVKMLWNSRTIRREDGTEAMILRNVRQPLVTLKGLYPKANGLGLKGNFVTVVTTVPDAWETPCYRLPDDRVVYLFGSKADDFAMSGERVVRGDKTTYTIRGVRSSVYLPEHSDAVTLIPPTANSQWIKDLLKPYVDLNPLPPLRAQRRHPDYTKREIMQLPDDLRQGFLAARPFDTVPITFA